MSEISAADKYVFLTEWFDCESALLKKFSLFFFPFDGTLELYDLKNRRMFLKRTRCEGVSLADMFLGNTVEIFARQIKIVDYGDERTKNKMAYTMQKTFAMIKPDGIEKLGSILRIISKNNFKIARLKMVLINRDQGMEFFSEHAGQSFIPYLMEHMMSGPIVAMELVSENAIEKWRQLVGPFDPDKAKIEAPNSIRACFGKTKIHNAVHSADSLKTVELESQIFFPKNQDAAKPTPKTTARFKNSTCCVVKPCAIKDGKFGDIVSVIQENNFEIAAMEMFYMTQIAAAEFYEVYNTVVPEYPAMVSHLCSGPCVAMEICSSQDIDVAVEFRKLVGPTDPDIARQLRPHTIRARFGKSKVENAVHVTDLPQDAPLEVEYFFKLLTM